jgi:hypothetical protein
MTKIFTGVFIALLISACTSLGRYENNATLNSDDESYFLFGMKRDLVLGFYRGDVENGRFSQNIFFPATLYAAPVDGYIMGKAPEGTTQALLSIRLGGSMFAPLYKPSGDAKAIVFNIPGGKVLYLGDITFVFNGLDYVKPVISRDIDAAKKYINKYHPQLEGKVVSWEYQLLTTTK